MRDYLYELMEQLIKTIDECFDDPDDLYYSGEMQLMPSIDILCLLSVRYGASVNLTKERVRKWKADFLPAFDEEIKDYDPTGEFATERRKVIEETFAKLEGLAEE